MGGPFFMTKKELQEIIKNLRLLLRRKDYEIKTNIPQSYIGSKVTSILLWIEKNLEK